MNKHQIIRFSAIGIFIVLVIGLIFSGSSIVNKSLQNEHLYQTSVWVSDDITHESLVIFEQFDNVSDLPSELKNDLCELNVKAISLKEINLPEIKKLKLEQCIESIPSGLIQIQME